mmetsp:Transcript_38053/g.104704  ORF Transcript_38053/g.104704 Transcript_38053/m.104704 type:complete len:432 (+) Transcript_38053:601-1896(+)
MVEAVPVRRQALQVLGLLVDGDDPLHEREDAARGGNVLRALDLNGLFYVFARLVPTLEADHAVCHDACLPTEQRLVCAEGIPVDVVGFCQGLFSLREPHERLLLHVVQPVAVANAHTYLSDVGQNLRKRNEVLRLGNPVDARSLATKLVAGLHLVATTSLLAEPRVGLAEIPAIEPRCHHATRLFHLHGFAAVLERQFRLVKSRVDPRKVAVQHVVVLPTLFRMKRNKRLELLQCQQSVVCPVLLHPDSASLVQGFHQPRAATFSAQRSDPVENPVGLVDLIVLQVYPYEVKGGAQVARPRQRSRAVAFWQHPRPCQHVCGAPKGHIEDAILIGLGRVACVSVFAALFALFGLLIVFALGARDTTACFCVPRVLLGASDQLPGELRLQALHEFRVRFLTTEEIDAAPNVALKSLAVLRQVCHVEQHFRLLL